MDLQTQLTNWGNLTTAHQNASRGKRGREAAARFENLLADNLLEIQVELAGKSYRPGRYQSFYIHEPKKRLISAAPFRDRVVHHALCQVTVPLFERKFIADSYANRVGKGTHLALERCQQFARRYKYFLQCDVVQFFPAIDHGILQDELAALLPDNSVLWLIERILASGRGILSEQYQIVYFPGDDLFSAHRPRGLPIGNLTSQWWANCYLNPFDQFVRRELGCQAYLRYVDDFLLFGDSKPELWEWLERLVKRLERYRLTIHPESAHPKPVSEGIPFLGFVTFPDNRRLKPRKGYTYRRKLHKLVTTASSEKIKASIQGWINHARYGDTFNLRREMLAECGLLAWEDIHA